MAFEMPWVPPGITVRVDGRGEFFVRHHRHPDPAAPVVLLLHGWTASSDLQFVAAYAELAERFSIVGLDHRGHGRGLRSPDPFTLEDAADDAAAVLRALGIAQAVVVGYSMGGPITLHLTRRHRELVAGIVVQATALEWRGTLRERVLWRLLPVGGSWLRTKGYRWYLSRTVPKLFHLDHEFQPYVPWLVSELSRNDAFAMVDAGRVLGRYDARDWAGSLAVPAASLVTTRDRLVKPDKQRALATALRATVRELPGDHLAALADARLYSTLTVELVDIVVAAGATSPASVPSGPPPSPVAPAVDWTSSSR